jgi:hypothetical protein
MGHVIACSAVTRMPIAAVKQRLEYFGYTVEPHGDISTAIAVVEDVNLVRRNPEAPASPLRWESVGPADRLWLESNQLVPLPHLIVSAAMMSATIAAVLERLQLLGYRVDHTYRSSTVPTWDDLRLISKECNGRSPWLDGNEVPLVHLLLASGKLGMTVTQIRDRLVELGFAMPSAVHPEK